MPYVLAEREVFAQYKSCVRELKAIGHANNLQNNEIDEILIVSMNAKECTSSSKSKRRGSTVKLLVLASIVSIILALAVLVSSIITYGVFTYHKQSYYVVARNVQDLIHPMMRILRHISLPMVRTFPGVTGLYDENCLLMNPFSSYRKTDCWPCTGVYSPIIITKFVDNPQAWQPYPVYPFLMKGVSSEVTFANLQDMYQKNQEVLDQYGYKIESSIWNWTVLSDVMKCGLEEHPTADKTAHITWRINQVDATRPIRKLFVRPTFIPPWVNVERFIFIDEQNSSGYEMPVAESFNVFLMQGCGERRVVLKPVHSCQVKCPKISVNMKPSYLLYFNNLYYILKSYPVNSSSGLSITYMGAY